MPTMMLHPTAASTGDETETKRHEVLCQQTPNDAYLEEDCHLKTERGWREMAPITITQGTQSLPSDPQDSSVDLEVESIASSPIMGRHNVARPSLTAGASDARSASTDPAVSDTLHRVNRFLTRLDINTVPSIEEGDIRCSVPEGRFKMRNNSPLSMRSYDSLKKSNSSNNISSPGRSRLSFKSPPGCQQYVIEGINGPVVTEKSPISNISKIKADDLKRRKNNKFRRFVAAKQNQRAKKFASAADASSHILQDIPGSSVGAVQQQQVFRERELPSIRHLSEMDTSFESCGTDASPTSAAVDIATEPKRDHKMAFTFVRVESNHVKGIVQQKRRKKKKKLTWWDDDVNAHKPFLLRTDESMDWEEDFDSTWNNVPPNKRKCNSDSILSVFDNIGSSLKKSINDYFEENKLVMETPREEQVPMSSFGNYLASLDEDQKMNELSQVNHLFDDFRISMSQEDDNGSPDGCSDITEGLLRYIKEVMPPVFEFDQSS